MSTVSTFNTTLHPTPFGFYDKFPLFQRDADAMVTFVLRTLGEDVLGVELTKPMIWSCFETATREFNGLMVEYQNKSNLASLLGMPTGSLDPVTGLNNINVSNMYVQQNLEFLANLAAPYAGIVGYGQSEQTHTGYLHLTNMKQDYDLYSELMTPDGTTRVFDLQPSGSVGSMEVVEVYHGPPAQYLFGSTIASGLVGSGLPVDSFIPDTRFHILPLFEDVLRAGAIETSQRIRRSHYSYRISGRTLRLYPVPNTLRIGYNDKVWLRIRFSRGPFPTLAETLVSSGSSHFTSGFGVSGSYQSDKVFGVGGPFNAPFGPLNYDSLNIWSRNWIAQYTLACSTELLGRVRSKFKSFPIPGAELSLNGEDLVSAGREDKKELVTSLRETLNDLTFDKIAEREAAKAENAVKQLQYVPMPPKYVYLVG